MKILDLFAGIGSFSMAGHWAGFETVGFVEWERFPQFVLKKNFPGVPIWSDIKQFSKKEYEKHYGRNAPTVDIITGGFPCQSFSNAGRRNGAEDDRYLWPEMLRVIQEFRPAWVIGENVAGILSMVQPEGVIKMEGSAASLFAEDSQIYTEEYRFITESICQDFERVGYQVQPFVIPACATGANHRRDRVWFIANTSENAINAPINQRRKPLINKREEIRATIGTNGNGGFTTPTDKTRLEKSGKQNQRRTRATANRCDKSELFRQTVPPVCGANDGLPVRLDGYKLTRNQHQEERLKCLGNAIVPQVAYEIFKAIREL